MSYIKMKKRAKISALRTTLMILLIFFIIIALFTYIFREYFLETKLRGIETGENIADAYIQDEETAFITLGYDRHFNNLYETTIVFYDDGGNSYPYLTYVVSYEHQINASDINLPDFSSIKGVYAEYVFKAGFPHPGNETNSTSSSPSLSPLSEFWSWIKSLL